MAVSWCFAAPSLVAGAVVAHLAGAGPGGADWRRVTGRRTRDCGSNSEERPGSGRLRGIHTHAIPWTGALFVMHPNGWDHALKVTGAGTGLVGHAGAILLRKAADQAGLSAGVAAALRGAREWHLFARGAARVSMGAPFALGSTN